MEPPTIRVLNVNDIVIEENIIIEGNDKYNQLMLDRAASELMAYANSSMFVPPGFTFPTEIDDRRYVKTTVALTPDDILVVYSMCMERKPETASQSPLPISDNDRLYKMDIELLSFRTSLTKTRIELEEIVRKACKDTLASPEAIPPLGHSR